MAWTYRYMVTDTLMGKEYAIHEVYDGNSWTEHPVAVRGESVESLKWQLEEMLKCLEKGEYVGSQNKD